MTHTAYFVTCNRCDLHDAIETKDWRTGGIRITCCQCKRVTNVAFPEASRAIVCPICNTETRIKRIDTEV
jgi:ribosomal protein S27E